MKEFVEYIVKHLVDRPEEVRVTAVEGEQAILYELRVGKSDYGKVIGKRGRNIQSIQTLLYAASGKKGKHVILEIVE